MDSKPTYEELVDILYSAEGTRDVQYNMEGSGFKVYCAGTIESVFDTGEEVTVCLSDGNNFTLSDSAITESSIEEEADKDVIKTTAWTANITMVLC